MITFSRKSPLDRGRVAAVAGAIAAMAAIAALGACKGLTSIDASFDNVTDTLEFYALNGSPPGAPTAISLFSGLRERADQSFAYDVAFDITPDSQVKIIPARALASGFAVPYSVGLLKVPDVTFATLDRAPKDGYTVDSTMNVTAGTVVSIQSFDANRCGFAIKGQSYFSKFVVTHVDLATRKITTVIEVNRNCGFRSFADGKPKD